MPDIAIGKKKDQANVKLGVPAPLFYALTGVLLVTNALAVTAFLFSPDIAQLARGNGDQIVDAYESRIADLRMEIDRLNSRQYARAGDINLQIQDLVQSQETLLAQQQFVRALADKADELGLVANVDTNKVGDQALLLPPTTDDVDLLRQSVDSMLTESKVAMSALASAAEEATDKISTELQRLGLAPDLSDSNVAIGGPLVQVDQHTSALDEANSILNSFGRFAAAKKALQDAPVRRPLTKVTRISSNFGVRKDPFTKGSAFHAGMDFPAATGTKVVSAGPGEVVFAGRKSGYGNVVDVRHAGGLVTRYGHMSAIDTKTGAWVSAGQQIGRVGSTGRSTGPHLHFEVRVNDKPVDPAQFLNAGKRLSTFL